MNQMKIEYVYVLTNKSFDERVVKVGFSDDPMRRARELHGTSLPHPFEIAYAVPVYRAYELEQLVHKSLHSHRLNNDREFFDCGVATAINTIREHLPLYSNALTKEIDASYSDNCDPGFSVRDKSLAEKLGEEAGFNFDGAQNPFDWGTVNTYADLAGCSDSKALLSFKDGWLNGLGRRERLEQLEASKLEELRLSELKAERSAKAIENGSTAFDDYYSTHNRLDCSLETRHAAAIKYGYQRDTTEYDLFVSSWDDSRAKWIRSHGET